MSFLYPVFLVGAAAIAIPLLLHFLRRDVAPEVPFSAVRLLRRTPLERSRRRRLRDLLLLAARVAALLLLAGAFARPYFRDSSGAGLHIVAVDRSFSMGAPDRFERARQLASGEIRASSGAGRSAAVIAFDDRAEVVAGPGDASTALAALDALGPGYGGTRYRPMLERAIELSGGGAATLSVVTDLQRAGWEDEPRVPVPAGLDVRVHDAGADVRNVAITSVRRTRDAVVAAVRNEGSEAISRPVRARLDGKPIAARDVSVPADAAVSVLFEHRWPPAGVLSVEIDDPAGFPADNVRYSLLNPATGAGVLILRAGERGARYVTRALEAAADDLQLTTTSIGSESFSRMSAGQLAETRAIVLLSTRGFDRRARDTLGAYVRSGGGLFIAASPDLDPAVLGAALNWPQFPAVAREPAEAALAATDLRHPVFAPFGVLAANLGRIRFSRVWRVDEAGWQVAARFTDGSPALLERREGAGLVVLFASDLNRQWNTFPLETSFVPFAVEIVRHVAGGHSADHEYVVAGVPAGASAEPGVQVLQPGGRRITVNVDVRESATARMTPAEFVAMVERETGNPAGAATVRPERLEARQNLWRYGLFLMLGVLMAESIVGRSRY